MGDGGEACQTVGDDIGAGLDPRPQIATGSTANTVGHSARRSSKHPTKPRRWPANHVRSRPRTWVAKAKETPVSWWPDWIEWIATQAPEKVPARKPTQAGRGRPETDRRRAEGVRKGKGLIPFLLRLLRVRLLLEKANDAGALLMRLPSQFTN